MSFYSFPREIGLPERRLIKSVGEMKSYLERFNGLKNLYTTCYSFEHMNGDWHVDYQTAIVDKLFFDFDGENAFENAKKLHEFLIEKQIVHFINFSGGGYQVFVHTEVNHLQNPRGAVANAQTHILQKLGIQCDDSCIGDLARLVRLPNTFNCKEGRKRFCIPLIQEDIERGHEAIKQIAMVQKPYNHFYFGGKLLSIRRFDGERTNYSIELPELQNGIFDNEKILLPPIFKRVLQTHQVRWKMRYYIILYLREIGLSKDEVVEFLKHWLTPEKWRHCIVEERQVDYVFRRADLFLPNPDFFEQEGFPINDEDKKILEGVYV